MKLSRRAWLGGLIAGPVSTAFAAGAWAAPVLSPNNYGLAAQGAARRNAWLEIDAEQFEANIQALEDLLEPDPGRAEICLVMKADAYGHGIDLLMPSIMKARIRCVGIASNDEARIVRDKRFGYAGRILRLRAAAPDEIMDGVDFDIEELVGNRDEAAMMADIGSRGPAPLRVHFALNSAGMSRNGLELSTEEGRRDALAILRMSHLQVVGLMTHYPEENAVDVRARLQAFNADVQWILDHAPPGAFDHSRLARHSANSYAALNVPASRLSMVRVGGAVYGDTDPRFAQFRRIMTLKSRVASVNHYPRGDTVSYDRTFQLQRDSWLANIPIGYSDGYRRVFSHANTPAFAEEGRAQAQMLIGGARAPVVGRVTMNTVMVDVTDLPVKPRIGDEVVLYGKQGGDEITQAELERAARTYGGDFYTVWGNALPKMLKPRAEAL